MEVSASPLLKWRAIEYHFMKKELKRALFLFRRDLRLDDNTGLLYALKNADVVYPVFVFDKKQIDPEKNKFFGSNCVQFMCESLEDLDKQIKDKGGAGLTTYHGNYPEIIEQIITAIEPNLLCVNMDYTPYAIERDNLIKAACLKHNVEFKSFEDICLLSKERATSGLGEGTFYKKFTPFYNRMIHYKIPMPEECKLRKFADEKVFLDDVTVEDFGKKFYEYNEHLEVRGGRTKALEILANIGRLKEYETIRNKPYLKTSQLSAYNKFGAASIREVYYTSKTVLKEKGDAFLRQLYWRDFYYYISLYYPHIYKGPMKLSYSEVPWENDETKIEAWKNGKTGCPIVDAAMRQMNKVGWMPNRVRMITSCYLIKDLHVNWQIGEQYFANKLVDYDPAQNNGGWQWSSGSGVDSQPYFRIFNPTLQMEKFDPQCVYMKTWIPELKSVPNEDIINWETAGSSYSKKIDYPKAIVKHAVAKEKIIDLYKASFNKTAGQPIYPDGTADKEEENLEKPKKSYGQKAALTAVVDENDVKPEKLKPKEKQLKLEAFAKMPKKVTKAKVDPESEEEFNFTESSEESVDKKRNRSRDKSKANKKPAKASKKADESDESDFEEVAKKPNGKKTTKPAKRSTTMDEEELPEKSPVAGKKVKKNPPKSTR